MAIERGAERCQSHREQAADHPATVDCGQHPRQMLNCDSEATLPARDDNHDGGKYDRKHDTVEESLKDALCDTRPPDLFDVMPLHDIAKVSGADGTINRISRTTDHGAARDCSASDPYRQQG